MKIIRKILLILIGMYVLMYFSFIFLWGGNHQIFIINIDRNHDTFLEVYHNENKIISDTINKEVYTLPSLRKYSFFNYPLKNKFIVITKCDTFKYSYWNYFLHSSEFSLSEDGCDVEFRSNYFGFVYD